MSVPLMSVTAYIALGSNLGDRRANLAAAIAALAAVDGVSVIRVATTIETAPIDSPPDSPPFFNTVAELVTSLEPVRLLETLHTIEASHGRERRIHNGPRTIDLDLLLFDDRIVNTSTLTLPHPRMYERRFVLAPLAEIAGRVIHPVLHESIAELLSKLDACRPHS